MLNTYHDYCDYSDLQKLNQEILVDKYTEELFAYETCVLCGNDLFFEELTDICKECLELSEDLGGFPEISSTEENKIDI